MDSNNNYQSTLQKLFTTGHSSNRAAGTPWYHHNEQVVEAAARTTPTDAATTTHDEGYAQQQVQQQYINGMNQTTHAAGAMLSSSPSDVFNRPHWVVEGFAKSAHMALDAPQHGRHHYTYNPPPQQSPTKRRRSSVDVLTEQMSDMLSSSPPTREMGHWHHEPASQRPFYVPVQDRPCHENDPHPSKLSPGREDYLSQFVHSTMRRNSGTERERETDMNRQWLQDQMRTRQQTGVYPGKNS